MELKAEKLILLSDVAGVLAKRGRSRERISRMTAAEARKLARSAAVTGGMVAKLEEVAQVAESGSARVHIVNGNRATPCFRRSSATKGAGTMVAGA